MDKMLQRVLQWMLLAPDTGVDGGEEAAEEATVEEGDEPAEDNPTDAATDKDEPVEDGGDPSQNFSNKGQSFDKGEEKDEEGKEFTPATWQAQTNGTNKVRRDLAEFSTIDELIAEKDRLEKVVKDGNIDFQDDSVKDSVFKKLGTPETPEGYEFDLEQEGLDKERTQEFIKKAHEKNLTKEQFDFAMNETLQYAKDIAAEVLKNYAGEPDAAEAHAREKWGTKFNERFENFQRALALGDKDFRDWVKTYKIDNNPKMIDFLERIGSYFGEDNVPLGTSEGGVVDDKEAALRRRYPSMYQ